MIRGRIFSGGAKVPHHKNTEHCDTIVMETPKKVRIPMLQHIGAPCDIKVAKGDYVKVGQVIGDSQAFVSAPIHSSVSGVVCGVGPMLSAHGRKIMSVEIETDGKQEVHESVKPPEFNNRDDFVRAIRQSGLVGLGGAGFPTHVKLMPPKDKAVDTLIINAAECEPYITADYRECIENSWGIISGIKTVIEQLDIKKVFIGVEDNKPEAIEALTKIADSDDKINVVTLKSVYPQGAEKMLIYATTGRKVPPGKLPSDVGCIVLNVTSVSFIAQYCKTGMPLIKKRITVDGSVAYNPSNVEVLIGTQIKDVFDFCGGFKKDPYKILMGGPMMGVAQYSLETSIIKNTNALLAFDKKDGDLPPESACIRCGRCVEACPMNLLPLEINKCVLKQLNTEISKYNTMDCIECCSCSFVCPSKRHLVQSIRLGKDIIRRNTAKK